HYKAIFGAGDSQSHVPHGVARFGEIRVDAGGSCEAVAYRTEEQVYVMIEGGGTLHYAGEKLTLRKHDFLYLPPGVRHAMASTPGARFVVMGFKVPSGS